VPIPYPVIVSMSSDLENGSTTVKADGGNMIAIKDCDFSRCTGDEAGTAGGVASSTFGKEAKFILYSFDVKIDGGNACRLSDKMTMNHQNAMCLGGVIQATVFVDVEPTANTIKCMKGDLVVQNNNMGIDRSCTEAHEASHAQDWKDRYGEDCCKGVPDGKLPVGGDGYTEFLRRSEVKAYKVGIACRQELLKTANAAQKADILKSIARDIEQIARNGG